MKISEKGSDDISREGIASGTETGRQSSTAVIQERDFPALYLTPSHSKPENRSRLPP